MVGGVYLRLTFFVVGVGFHPDPGGLLGLRGGEDDFFGEVLAFFRVGAMVFRVDE